MSNSDNNWHAQETYRSMVEYARGMLRFCFLANGGAIIAILTFIGNLYGKENSVPSMKAPLVIFLLGVFLAGISGITTYYTQFMLFNESINNTDAEGWSSHTRWLKITLALIIISIFTFAAGAFIAVSRLQ